MWRVRETSGGPEAVPGTGEPMDPGSGGQASYCGTATRRAGGRTLKKLDATEQAVLAVGTPTQCPGQEFEECRLFSRG